MLGSAFWPGFVPAVVALPGDVVHAVLVAAWVTVAGVFVVRSAAHLLQPAAGRTTGETFPRSGSGPRMLETLISVDTGGSPTPLASADSSRTWDAA